jgi:hypothetical protein
VHVLDQHDNRLFRCELGQESRPGRVQAVARRERMEIAGDVEPEREPENLASTEPAADVVGPIGFTDLDLVLQDLAEGPSR